MSGDRFLGFIGVDRSGQLGAPPYYMIATRMRGDKQLEDDAIKFTKSDLSRYSKIIKGDKKINKDLKIAAVITFLVVKPPLFRKGDIIHIDKDYNATDEKIFVKDLRKLFDTYYYGKSLFRNPTIEFHIKEVSKYVKRADRKSKQAWKGKFTSRDCPNLTRFMEYII